MNLRSDMRQKNTQASLDFRSVPTGETRQARGEATESLSARHASENPASTNQLMEEVCEWENLKQALQQVKANKGSPGIDGMTVEELPGYRQQHWPSIREQLLNGTYEPKPVRRVEIEKPDGGGITTALPLFRWAARFCATQFRGETHESTITTSQCAGNRLPMEALQYIGNGADWRECA